MQTQLIFSQEDSLANHTPKPGSDSAKKMTDISGQKCCEQLERLNQVGLWAKMFTALLIGMEGWYSTKCNLTWKLKGTKYGRFYCQLFPSTHPTEGTEFGLLPTVTAMDSTNATATMKSTQVKEGSMHSVTLTRAMTMGMLPTPMASDATTGSIIGKNDIYRETSGLPRKVNQNGKDGSVGLARLIKLTKGRMGDVPSYIQDTMKIGDGKPSQLSPQFVLEMMGFPTDWTLLPFLNGETNQSKQEEMP